jgi:hypothetical protein
VEADGHCVRPRFQDQPLVTHATRIGAGGFFLE